MAAETGNGKDILLIGGPADGRRVKPPDSCRRRGYLEVIVRKTQDEMWYGGVLDYEIADYRLERMVSDNQVIEVLVHFRMTALEALLRLIERYPKEE